jgi:hypothetical protein
LIIGKINKLGPKEIYDLQERHQVFNKNLTKQHLNTLKNASWILAYLAWILVFLAPIVGIVAFIYHTQGKKKLQR